MGMPQKIATDVKKEFTDPAVKQGREAAAREEAQAKAAKERTEAEIAKFVATAGQKMKVKKEPFNK